MPISAEQWRMAVGKMNANKSCPATRHKSSPMTPCEGSPRKPSAREERREYVANLLTVLYVYFLALRSIVSDVFRSERDENEGSTKKMKAKGKGMQGSLVMLLRLLLFITALLLLMGGDVERNPGPPKKVAATGDKTLSLDDAATVLEELYKAQNHSQFIGLKLKVPQHIVDGILKAHSEPRDQLYDVIVEYLKQVEPGPTWRAIADALRSPVINLTHLAKTIEEKYCVAPTTPQRSELSATAHDKTESHVIEEEYYYNFVEQLSEDFFCPVTKGLLLQPHLTACCGHHLSDEAVTKIQGMGGACPMCRTPNLLTILDKHFRRQIYQLRVFCRRKGKGCEWKGELSELEHHMKSHYDKEMKDMFKEAMQKGYVKCRLILLILVGVAGSGKTSFKHLVLGLPPPELRVSTPLAEAAVRSMSVYHVAIDNEEECTWQLVSPEEFHDMVADAVKKGVPLEPKWDVDELSRMRLGNMEKPESSSSVMSKHNVDPQGSKETNNPLRLLKKKNVDLGHFSPEISAVLDSITVDVDMLEKISSSSCSGKLLDVDWVYIVDSGGQPQFREMLPHFVRDCSAFVMMQKLNESLGCATNIEYRVEGGKMHGAPCQSQLTNEQILYQYFQAIQSHKSRVFVVGTFSDEEYKCSDEPRAAKDEKLLAAFRPVLGDNLVLYQPGKPDQFIFPLNCKIDKSKKTEPKNDSEKVVEKFRKSVMKYCLGEEVKIPLPWFMLDGLLKQFQEKSEKKVLSLEECYVLAEKVHMSPRMCTAALQFLSRLNIVFYRPSILPNVIFSDSQAVLDSITELVRCSHELKSDAPGPQTQAMCGGEWLDFREKGRINVNFLKEKRFSKHYRPGLFEAKHFLDLLKGMLLAASLGNDEYFMPSLLPDLNPEKIEEWRVGQPAPMSIRYVNTWLPVGLVPSLVAELQNKLNKQLQNNHEWEPKLNKQRNPECMFRNCMQFKLPGGEPGSIILIDSIAFLEIHLRATDEVAVTVCPDIRKMILAGLQEAHISLHCGPAEVEEGFLCSCEYGLKTAHFAGLNNKGNMWTCTEDPDTGGFLREKHTVWFKNGCGHKHTLQGCQDESPTNIDTSSWHDADKMPKPEDERPDLRSIGFIRYKHDLEIKEYRLIDVIATEWQAIGRELGIKLSKLTNINSSHRDPNAAANEMLRFWMGSDLGATWAKLIQAMKVKKELTVAAAEFEYALLHRIKED